MPPAEHSPARRPLIAGNWKMHLDHREAIRLVQELAFSLTPEQLEAVEVALLPPYTDLRSVQTLIDGDQLLFRYGGQDLSAHDSGAYTGEVSGAMLARLGCCYVVVGHSERREYHHEDDELVGLKVAAAIRHRLAPILCVGERLEVRHAGGQVAHCVGQLEIALAGLGVEQIEDLVIAYEPVWAIGTGEVATPEDAQEVCAALRRLLTERYGRERGAATRLLYGGSVQAANIAGIMAMSDVDGALVGGASLDAAQFAQICRLGA